MDAIPIAIPQDNYVLTHLLASETNKEIRTENSDVFGVVWGKTEPIIYHYMHTPLPTTSIMSKI
jgi:hypothetical protein